MRLLNSFLPAVCIVFIGATSALAQNPDERRTEEQYETYHKHYDRHHGHNHAYPDRGAIFRDAPRGAILVNYAGVSYRFADGVWYEPRGPAFIVVAPPIGLLVPALPGFATPVVSGGENYLYANDVYYRARPEIGGYEVVNEPLSPTAVVEPGGAFPTNSAASVAVPAAAGVAGAAGAALASTPAAVATAAPAVVATPVPAASAAYVPQSAGTPVSNANVAMGGSAGAAVPVQAASNGVGAVGGAGAVPT